MTASVHQLPLRLTETRAEQIERNRRLRRFRDGQDLIHALDELPGVREWLEGVPVEQAQRWNIRSAFADAFERIDAGRGLRVCDVCVAVSVSGKRLGLEPSQLSFAWDRMVRELRRQWCACRHVGAEKANPIEHRRAFVGRHA